MRGAARWLRIGALAYVLPSLLINLTAFGLTLIQGLLQNPEVGRAWSGGMARPVQLVGALLWVPALFILTRSAPDFGRRMTRSGTRLGGILVLVVWVGILGMDPSWTEKKLVYGLPDLLPVLALWVARPAVKAAQPPLPALFGPALLSLVFSAASEGWLALGPPGAAAGLVGVLLKLPAWIGMVWVCARIYRHAPVLGELLRGPS